jgi:hypothetical protein
MNGDCIWFVTYTPFACSQPRAEIHIFKPYGPESFIKTAHLLPRLAAKHEKRSRRLLDGLCSHRVEIQATIMPIHPITRPYSINAENFEDQRRGRGQAAREESDLRRAIERKQKAASSSHVRIGKTVGQSIDAAHNVRIRIEQQHQRGAGGANPLIHRPGKTGIGLIRDQSNAASFDLSACAIGRCVIYHNYFQTLARSKRVETGPDFCAGVISDDDDRDTRLCQCAPLRPNVNRNAVNRKYHRQ